MENLELRLPENFWFGTSLSAHQAEGGNHNSWTRWEALPGKIKNNEQSGEACRHWELYEEDFKLLTWLGADTHRFSLEWSRLEPKQGQWSSEVATHYRNMIRSLKNKNIRPILCLFHFSLPTWFEDEGAFETHDGIKKFLNFVRRCAIEFGDLADVWLTMNEPVVYALAGYGAALTPPGKRDLNTVFQVIANLYEAHAEAYQIIKKSNPKAQVSVAHHMRILTPERKFFPLDWILAKQADQIFNWSFLDFVKTGRIRFIIPGVCYISRFVKSGVGSLDFLGVNYYGRDYLSFRPFQKDKINLIQKPPYAVEKTDMGWEIYPEGLERILKGISKHKLNHLPLVMTENGIADHDDDKRPQFIYDHLKRFLVGCERWGLKAAGYLHWSLLDNFEWIDGFYPRFGLFSVDYVSQKREPRFSAHFFKDIAKSRILKKPIF